ncbi:MAG TPA: heavy metal translocating P-type ATPase [Polyangiaceae bacterium]|nr:heavy metal translocating P-type ATPase [Polyangiaceae bacterium]
MKKLKLDLALVLPEDASACSACAARIVESLRGRPGISEVHIDTHAPASPQLCLHYDPDVVDVERVRKVVQAAGGEIRQRFEHVAVAVVGLRHERQAGVLEAAIARAPGILHVVARFGTGRLSVEFDPLKTSRAAVLEVIASVGLEVRADSTRASPAEEPAHEHEHSGPFGERSELIFSLICGALTGLGWALGKWDAPELASRAASVLAYGFGSWFTFREALVALRARKFEIDFLMLLAALGAAVLGEWSEGALLLFLFTLGHALEGFAMGRARKAIAALSELVPATALLLENGIEREVPVESLAVGDRVEVKPNTRLPADGFVEQGVSSVNQAPITGESVPVDKRPVADPAAALQDPATLQAENRVFAGSINGSAALRICVTKVAADSTLSRVAKMVSEAESQKAATQIFTDRFERVFVPVILGVVGLLLLAWVVVDEPFAQSFYRAMAVLVAASPCALAIATPSAVLSGVARAARSGVLVKGGAHLEALGLVRTMAFDKTGTLTEGKPRLTDIRPLPDVEETRLLLLARAIEQKSDHPLAGAIVTGAGERLPENAVGPEVIDAESIIGFGIQGKVEGVLVRVGKPGLFTQTSPLPAGLARSVEELQRTGRTVMVVQIGDQFLGALGVMDTPRASARLVILELKALGIERTIMLTGDNQDVADAVAAEVGIQEARGDLLPEQKVAAVAELARGKSRVAMIGDGVNDAPALAHATVGIAMGAGGSDVALEAADIALMADDLSALPFAVGLSRTARRIIQQNLWLSLGMVAFLIPATILGFAGIGLAVALHEGSTLLVVVNALRLLTYQDARKPASVGLAPRGILSRAQIWGRARH